MSGKYTLFHSEATSSTAVEAAFKVLLEPAQYEIIELDFDATTQDKSNADDERVQHMQAANPLLQFPTVIAPDGSVLTEVVAILLYLLEAHGADSHWGTTHLTSAQRAAFYRWLLFIPDQLYPTITILGTSYSYCTFPPGSSPSPPPHPCTEEEVHGWLLDTVKQRRKDIFTIIETEFIAKTLRQPGQYVLGTDHPTVLDIFLAVVVHYSPKPRPEWIKENCPLLTASVQTTLRVPELREVFVRNDMDFFL
ncbi:hypothetical protein BKA62DRAFT_775481 [Auriculariales sp. MPI-PUGE-AT-0066]|nr:hypothetical protein BKA62DRAFT_775481 [Auriculariales sp. MPI-PUGE-AT-0066]